VFGYRQDQPALAVKHTYSTHSTLEEQIARFEKETTKQAAADLALLKAVERGMRPPGHEHSWVSAYTINGYETSHCGCGQVRTLPVPLPITEDSLGNRELSGEELLKVLAEVWKTGGAPFFPAEEPAHVCDWVPLVGVDGVEECRGCERTRFTAKLVCRAPSYTAKITW
jgi:hypothetical protein